MPNKKIKLKPCPFCGKSVADWNRQKPPYMIICMGPFGGCGASSGYYQSKAKAREAWNRRAEKEEDDAEVH